MEVYFLTVMEARSSRSRFWLPWFLVRALFLAERWSPFHHVPTWPFLSARTWPEREIILSFSTYKASNPIGLGPHPYDLISWFVCFWPPLITWITPARDQSWAAVASYAASAAMLDPLRTRCGARDRTCILAAEMPPLLLHHSSNSSFNVNCPQRPHVQIQSH